MKIELSFTKYKESDLLQYQNRVSDAHVSLHNGTGEGSDFIGWLDYTCPSDELQLIKNLTREIKEKAEVLIVVGIGGSYLGAKSVIEALGEKYKKDTVEVLFTGNSVSTSDLTSLLEYVKDKSVYVNVISKSGRTLESSIAFRIISEHIKAKYKDEYSTRIVVTTDPTDGALNKLKDIHGFRKLSIPKNIGGRYSVITPVGLLPISVAGYDIEGFIEGVKEARREFSEENILKNSAYKYAVLRNLYYEKEGKALEALTLYEPRYAGIGQWYQQLFGESEGKDKKGIYPSFLINTTDLHSLGQYVQDGKRQLFETVLWVENIDEDIIVQSEEDNVDGLNYLKGKSLLEINKTAMLATALSHLDGGSESIFISLDRMDEEEIGRLYFFFMKACAIGGYLLGVNPFNQPGVEGYKNNMFELLGKPGTDGTKTLKRLEEIRSK